MRLFCSLIGLYSMMIFSFFLKSRISLINHREEKENKGEPGKKKKTKKKTKKKRGDKAIWFDDEKLITITSLWIHGVTLHPCPNNVVESKKGEITYKINPIEWQATGHQDPDIQLFFVSFFTFFSAKIKSRCLLR